MRKPPDSPQWVFDELPPSGQRRGGDPSEYAFPRTLDAFVREALQNANDQSLPNADTRAEVHIDLEEVGGNELEDFLDALGWHTLERHLQGAAEVPSASKFRSFADTLRERRSLVLLRIEDRHTSGLRGEENTGDDNFRLLCRDSLLSHKHESAGGSYGLGKSVYWAFSRWSTVLFHSCIADNQRHRLIGRVELPSHVASKSSYMGPGWFGRRERAPGGERAVSLWDHEARELARRLRIARPPRISGTTILVVGFYDPTDDDTAPLAETRRRIRESAARFFWPAMNFPRPLRIVVNDEPVGEYTEVAAFANAWRQRGQAGARLVEPGDVARVQVPLTVPRPRKGKGTPEITHCELLVRLAEPDPPPESLTHDNQLAVFRGPGMVVKYHAIDPAGNLPRFHALLACGAGRAPEKPSPEDQRAEAFLRKCEPPGHDEWGVTPRLRDDYCKGGGVGLDNLFDAVRKALHDLLLPPSVDARRGPELLQRRFPLGSAGDSAAAMSNPPFHFRNLTAVFEEGRWRFNGTVEPVTPSHAWTATIHLKVLGDDGGDAGDLRIREFTLLDGGDSRYEHTDEGAIRLTAGRKVKSLRFSGWSEPLPDGDQLCELGLKITGELRPKGAA